MLTGKAFDKDNQFVLARLIKPYTDREIDTMQIDDKAKAILKVKTDSVSSFTPYAIYTRDAITKYDNTGIAGTYQGRIRLHSKKSNGEDVVQLFYIIKPNSKALTISPYKFDLPSGYIYANKLYYISPFPLSNDPSSY